MRRALSIFLLLLLSLPATAGRHQLLIVSGLGGTTAYDEQFSELATRLARAARDAGVAPEQITTLSASADADAARADRDTVLAAVSRAAETLDDDDRFFLILIGHGNPRGDGAVFNLPGPDLTATELAAALEAFGERLVTVVNTASSSGPFLARLSAPNRVVITATANAREYHAPLFGEYFVSAFESAGADRDKDERISMLEAFEFASREVRRNYESEKRLLIEHALLDDNGDGEGSQQPGEFAADGALAHRVYLRPALSASAGAPPEVLAMQRRKQELELSIAELKQRRDGLPRTQYYDRLEVLLIDLALLNRELRATGD
jgi:hypothetical protein